MTTLLDALAWIGDPHHWWGPSGITHRLGQHLAITAIALVIAAGFALPVGLLIGHTRRGRGAVVALAGAARAVPTLGLLTLLTLGMGIGVRAPIVVLVVLAVPSLLAGAYGGVESIDRTITHAARATGMNEWQVLTQVELPLAAPVILGGIRAAMLQVVATATLAAYVSDTGLGRYLFTGLKSRDYPQMLAGALLVATLAVVLDLTAAAVQRAARRVVTPPPEPRSLAAHPAPKGTP